MLPEYNWLNLTRSLLFKNKVQKDANKHKKKKKKKFFVSYHLKVLSAFRQLEKENRQVWTAEIRMCYLLKYR